MKNIFFYDTKIGKIAIIDNGKEITNIEIAEDKYSDDFILLETELIKNAGKQLLDYLDGFRTTFDLPLNPNGTVFQKKVWNALCDIPYGETRSYKQVAEAVGNNKASRAIGMANNKNPIMIVIPCHRVIGSNGSLVGYAGGLDIKEKLIFLENKK
ncbi:MAG: Methylated-DNA--protein-cysteine methyltransferase [Sedimentibacter sp.]|jgi:methylated-DNA-[protein]-cysteine S-methyltransferase|nr:Methylated-DNA--protein-cysteine methyltransferase [Sedimentibacter sp.]